MKLCSPALLYLIMCGISLLCALPYVSGLLILVKLFFIIIWTWFLNFLCSKGYSTVSWILVLMPFILFGLIILLAIEVVNKSYGQERFFGLPR
jgi:hypothetical protein